MVIVHARVRMPNGLVTTRVAQMLGGGARFLDADGVELQNVFDFMPAGARTLREWAEYQAERAQECLQGALGAVAHGGTLSDPDSIEVE